MSDIRDPTTSALVVEHLVMRIYVYVITCIYVYIYIYINNNIVSIEFNNRHLQL